MNDYFIRLAPRANNPPHPWQVYENDQTLYFAGNVVVEVPATTTRRHENTLDRFGRHDREGLQCRGHLHRFGTVIIIKDHL